MTLEDEWTRPQKELAAVVYRAWHPQPMDELFRWPAYRYVAHEMRLRHSADAHEVLASFPVLGDVGIGKAHYSAVAFDRLWPTNPDAPVRLTVAGLARTAGPEQDPAGIFLALLEHAGQQLRRAPVDPYEPQAVMITNESFSQACCAVSPGVSAAMYDLIPREPSAVTGLTPHHHNPIDGSWTAEVDWPALDFANGITLDTYLSRIDAFFSARTQQPSPEPRPPANSLRPREINATRAQGVIVGDGNTQHNYYYRQ